MDLAWQNFQIHLPEGDGGAESLADCPHDKAWEGRGH